MCSFSGHCREAGRGALPFREVEGYVRDWGFTCTLPCSSFLGLQVPLTITHTHTHIYIYIYIYNSYIHIHTYIIFLAETRNYE